MQEENKLEKNEEKSIIDSKRNDFDNFLTDAYSETSKFLEKLEKFQKKTVNFLL